MRRALVVCAAMLGVLLLGSAAFADIHAVAKPTTQTVAINGAAAEFDGSDSYTDEEMPISDWAWDFDGDSEDDYTENYQDPGGDGLTTYVYTKAGIFTCRLTVTDAIERQNANASQFTRYEVHKSTSQDFPFLVQTYSPAPLPARSWVKARTNSEQMGKVSDCPLLGLHPSRATMLSWHASRSTSCQRRAQVLLPGSCESLA